MHVIYDSRDYTSQPARWRCTQFVKKMEYPSAEFIFFTPAYTRPEKSGTTARPSCPYIPDLTYLAVDACAHRIAEL